jgi:large-conductance mechanosensitive channel
VRELAYHVKRGGEQKVPGTSFKGILVSMIKRLMVVLIIMALISGLAYIGFQIAYSNVPIFAEAADDVIAWLGAFYQHYGLWATVGLIIFAIAAVWALGEEAKKRERREEMTRDMMK